MINAIKRLSVIVLCIIVTLAFSVVLPSGSAMAKTTKMKLPVKVEYQYKSNGKWKTSYTTTFKYNKKGDVVKMVTSFDEEDESITDDRVTKITYKYSKGKRKSAVAKCTDDKYTFTFNKKNRIYKTKHTAYDDYWGNVHETQLFKYTKKGNITSIKWTSDDESYGGEGKGTDKYTTTVKKGKVTKVRIRSKVDGGTAVTATRKYNGKGLLTSEKSPGISYKYKYKMNGKYVKIRYEDTGNGYDTRKKYTYGTVKISPSVYYQIINLDERTVQGNLVSELQ